MVDLCILRNILPAIAAVGIILGLPYSWADTINCVNFGNQKCIGTDGDDLMIGRGGGDNMWGEGGNDKMIGGPGNDWMTDFKGDNWLNGTEGDDRLQTGSGNDIIWGSTGSDEIYSGRGADLIRAGSGNDTIYVGCCYSRDINVNSEPDYSKDTIYCGQGHDIVYLNSHDGDLAYDCEEVYDYKPPASTEPPQEQPPYYPGEDCDRSGMPGCS